MLLDDLHGQSDRSYCPSEVLKKQPESRKGLQSRVGFHPQLSGFTSQKLRRFFLCHAHAVDREV